MQVNRKISDSEIKQLEQINAVKYLSTALDNFFANNPNHLYFLEETGFFDMNESNDRFCRFCFIRKVKIYK